MPEHTPEHASPAGYGTVTPTSTWAIEPSALSVTEVTELFWGDRVGRVRDPFGNIWWLQSHVADVPFDEMQGRMTEPAMVEAMQYVQQTLVDELEG